jgi:hypothetical protein
MKPSQEMSLTAVSQVRVAVRGKLAHWWGSVSLSIWISAVRCHHTSNLGWLPVLVCNHDFYCYMWNKIQQLHIPSLLGQTNWVIGFLNLLGSL